MKKKELILGVGTVVICAAVKEVARIAWKRYKEKAVEEMEVEVVEDTE